ncbi:MAG TPA: glycosyltransferase, partial [Oligoflexia bacterium]|nr:glycosyltransferase [Oligoflexia bacterium]
GTPIVLGCGRLREQKNFALLIKALASLREKVAAKLVILGEGPQRKNLESLISELGLTADVSLPGEVENPLSYMAHASVFCLSSSWEGFGIVLVEALAMGLPVISTDCPSGPAEILDGGRFGELVPVGDLPALSCALEAALTHKTFDKNALIERASLFSSEAACREYRRLFAAL